MEWTDDQVRAVDALIAKAVFVTCRRNGLNYANESEDIAQKVWEKCLGYAEKYDDGRGAALTTFLYPLIWNRAQRFAREVVRDRGRRADLTDLEPARGDAEERAEMLERIRDADSTVVLAAAGYSDAEIATICEMDVKVVTARRRAEQRAIREAADAG